MSHIIVIGAGQAGSSLICNLRDSGFEGEITLIGAESVPPYQRPPLSKAYLLGEMEKERLFLRPEQFYADQNITLRLGAPVTAIDPAAKTVSIEGETLSYDQLAITTGSNPHHLPASIGGALNGVHVVRSLDDVDAMAADMAPGKRVLIVGGGYIGLEAASVASKMGLEVTVIEMADRILQRVAAPETSGYFRKLHKAHDVDVREGVGLDRLVGEAHVSGARFTDGSEMDVDIVIVGIGVAPGDALAADAGLTINNGIETDAHGRTSDPSIWAAGDCASFPWQGGRIRLESVQNAIDQAQLVAENIMGAGKEYVPMPWFWSDQYDVKLQIAGLNTGYDKIAVRHIDEEVSYWYYKGDKLLAVDAMNAPRCFMICKRLLATGKSPSADVVSNPDTDLKALL